MQVRDLDSAHRLEEAKYRARIQHLETLLGVDPETTSMIEQEMDSDFSMMSPIGAPPKSHMRQITQDSEISLNMET